MVYIIARLIKEMIYVCVCVSLSLSLYIYIYIYITVKAMKLKVKKKIIHFYFSKNNRPPIEANRKPIVITTKRKLIHIYNEILSSHY